MEFDPATGASRVVIDDTAPDGQGGGAHYLAALDVRTGLVREVGSTISDLDGTVRGLGETSGTTNCRRSRSSRAG